MKKIKTMKAMMMALCMGMALASCSSSSSNDPIDPNNGGNKKETVDFAKTIAGSYTNKLSMTVMGEESIYKNAEVKLDRVDSTHVNITLPACGEGMMALPALTVEKVEVTASGSEYKFAVENYSSSVSVNGQDKNWTVTLTGAYKDGVVTLDYSLQYGKMPMAMVAKFDSSATLTAAEEVADSYTSTLTITVMDETSTYEEANLVIDVVNDTKLKITLPACGEGAMALPALEIPEVEVNKESDGTYTFAIDSYAGTTTVNEVEKNYTVTLAGTLKDGVLTVNYNLQYGKMPMAMIGQFIAK